MESCVGFIHGIVASVLYAVAWPVLFCLGLLPGSVGDGWRERRGLLPAGLKPGAVWFHAASVGEVVALGPLVREISRLRPRLRMALSVMTPAGKERARSLHRIPVVHAPVDAPVPVRAWLKAAAPRSLIVVETELWPRWLVAASRTAPVAWVNGRISDRSFPRYRFVRSLIGPILHGMELLCVISRRDGIRAVRLGARPGRVRVMGNIKVDLMEAKSPPEGIRRGIWVVAGSTRPGEERMLLLSFRRVRRTHPRVRMCLAPRHLNRAARVARLASSLGFTVERRSEMGKRDSGRADVIVLDTHGELSAFYRLAVVAFVGGTMVPVGGHNVLEPAVARVPVIFGPYTANVREYAAGLVRCGGGFRISSPRELARRLFGFISSPGLARRAGTRALRYVRGEQGVARRVAKILIARGLV